MSLDYWLIAVQEAFSDNGIQCTEEQEKAIAARMEQASLMRSASTGTCESTSVSLQQMERLYKALEEERCKRVCIACKGSGRLHYYEFGRNIDMTCDKCQGEGKV
jgi:DnaJ-class molecular chaperone